MDNLSVSGWLVRGFASGCYNYATGVPADVSFCTPRRGTQVVRERSAKPLCVGSIPTRASILFVVACCSCLISLDSIHLRRFALDRPRWGQTRADPGPGARQKAGQKTFASNGPRPPSLGPPLIWELAGTAKQVEDSVPLGRSSLGQRHRSYRSIAPFRCVSRVNVPFSDSDRVVTGDFRERRQVDPFSCSA